MRRRGLARHGDFQLQQLCDSIVRTRDGGAAWAVDHAKARVRAKVEWPLRIVERVFGFTRVRYRGLKKNHEWLCAAFALANLYKNCKHLAKFNLQLALQGA